MTAFVASFAVVIPSDAPVESAIFAVTTALAAIASVSTALSASSEAVTALAAISDATTVSGEICEEPTELSASPPAFTFENAMNFSDC